MKIKKYLSIAILLLSANIASADVQCFVFGTSYSCPFRTGAWKVQNVANGLTYNVNFGCPIDVADSQNMKIASENFALSERPTDLMRFPEGRRSLISIRETASTSKYLPYAADMRFRIPNATGAFTQTNHFTFRQSGTSLIFNELVRIPLKGDTNGDGKVNKADIEVLASNFFKKVGPLVHPWESGDFNADGIVDYYDFFLLRENYLRTDGAELYSPSKDCKPHNVLIDESIIVADNGDTSQNGYYGN